MVKFDRKMRILWFSNSPCLGADYLNSSKKITSTGGWLYSLNKSIQSDVELGVCFHYPYRINSFVFENSEYFPVYTGNILINKFRSRFLTIIRPDEYLDQYLDVIRKFNPDIIHIHGTENFFLSIFDYVKIPIVVSIQGNITVINHKFFSGFYGRFLNRVRFGSLKELFLGRTTFKSSKRFFSKMALIEQDLMKDIQFVIGRTKWDFRVTRILSPYSYYFHGDEILRESFYLHSWNNPYSFGRVTIFTINSDSYFKGIETVFHSISILIGLGYDIEWRIAGITNSSLVKSISKSYLGNKFPKFGFRLLGNLNDVEITNELLRSHLYVMPSHIENSPNNLCEAMILGLPCIATFAGGTGSILQDGYEGILIQDGDPWAMAGAILELINAPSLSLFYGRNARIRALKRHDKDVVVNKYLMIYTEIFNRREVGN